jgi:DnaJ-class molecular chaperone
MRRACPTCNGSGWNQDIHNKPINITAPIGGTIGLKTLMDYLRKRLLCQKCNGTGRIT